MNKKKKSITSVQPDEPDEVVDGSGDETVQSVLGGGRCFCSC